MPIDPEAAVGAAVGEVSFSWISSDVVLYHLAIGRLTTGRQRRPGRPALDHG